MKNRSKLHKLADGKKLLQVYLAPEIIQAFREDAKSKGRKYSNHMDILLAEYYGKAH